MRNTHHSILMTSASRKIIACVGFTALSVFIASTAFALVSSWNHGIAGIEWTLNLIAFSFLTSLIALGIAMLVDYSARIHEQLRIQVRLLREQQEKASEIAARPQLSAAERDMAFEQLLKDSEELMEMAQECATTSREKAAEAVEVEG